MLYNLLLDILKNDENYNIFLKNLEDLEVSYRNRRDINVEADKQLDMYVENLEVFYSRSVKKILQYEKLIAYNYVVFLFKFYKYIGSKSFSIEYLSEFRKFAIRVMELALFIQQYKFPVNELFFSNINKSFYDNLIYIYEIKFDSKEIKKVENSETRVIEESIKLHSDGIFIGNSLNLDHFISTVKMAHGYKKISVASYLRLYELGVNNVYNIRSVSKKEGGGGGRFIILEKLNPYPRTLHHENKIIYQNPSETNDNDERLEGIARSSKRVLNKSDSLYSIQDKIKKYNRLAEDANVKLNTNTLTDKNQFKKFKIDTAIGHLSAKSNLILESKYTVPNIKLLAKFLNEIKDKSSFEYKLLICSIVLGIDSKRILAMKLKLTNELEIVNKDTIRVDLTTAYAQVTNYDIYKKTKNKVEFRVPTFIVDFFQESEEVLFESMQKIIKDQKILIGNDVVAAYEACKGTSSLYIFMQNNFQEEMISEIYNKLLDNQQKAISSFITKEKKSFDKRIVLSVKNLHMLSLYYYKLFHDESDINLLFLQKQTANIQTSEAYVACTKKLSTMTLWIEELMMKLSICHAEPNSLIGMDSEYSGSNKFITPQKFKTFLMIITSIELKNKHANLSLRMIYLRFVFSILLASRKYYFSTSLYQYSSREKLLFIHEKAKNVYNSKRIIPITELGVQYIRYFYKQREKFSITSYSPVLVLNNGKIIDFDKKNLKQWLEQHEEEIKSKCTFENYKIIEAFSKSTELDFGRHIFASHAHNEMELSQEYVDAMLNHFEKGTQDQGIYSLFDNKEYFNQIRNTMEKIEEKYIPFWSEL